MNVVEIRQSLLDDRLSVTINTEPISPYSDMAAIIKKPFPEWAVKILEELDAEIYDDYTVTYYGLPFQYEFLKHQKTDYCRSISQSSIPSLYSAPEIIQRLENMCRKHNLNIQNKLQITLYSQLSFPFSDVFLPSEVGTAELSILNSEEETPGPVSVVVYSQESIAVQTSYEKTIYHIPASLLDSFLEYYQTYCRDVPNIANCMSALKFTHLTPAEQAELCSIQENKITYYLGDLPSCIDADSVYPVTLMSFPDHCFTMLSTNPNVITIEEQALHALNGGNAQIVVLNADKQPVYKTDVQVIQHHYASDIRIIPHFEYLKVHDRQKLDLVIFPEDAEDKGELTWSVQPATAAQISSRGEILALENGSAVITVKGRKVSTKCTIDIRPDLQGLHFEPPKIQLIKGETKVIECCIVPPNAAVDKLSWNFDNGNIATFNPSIDGRKCQLIASGQYTGTGNLRCIDPATGIGAICNVEVIQNKASFSLATIALLCMIVGLFIPAMELIAAVISGAGLYVNRGKEQLGKYWRRLIISIILFIILTILYNGG